MANSGLFASLLGIPICSRNFPWEIKQYERISTDVLGDCKKFLTKEGRKSLHVVTVKLNVTPRYDPRPSTLIRQHLRDRAQMGNPDKDIF